MASTSQLASSLPGRSRFRPWSWLPPAVVAGGLFPFALMAYRAPSGRLGPDPVATAENQLGLLSLVLLMACLSCTPLKILTGATWPLRIRRTLGLLACFAVGVHFFTYAVVDQGAGLGAILRDVTRRPFITVGFLAFLGLLPLAATSTKASVARLGYLRWKRIHPAVYGVAVLGVIHFTMRVKADTREPFTWAAILGVLFAVRAVEAARKARSARAASGASGV